MGKKILVTGASGFVGSHCILDLLAHGYEVRGTVRDLSRADALKATLGKHASSLEKLEFVETSLTTTDGWVAAATGCDGIFHLASPVPIIQPKNASEVIRPAREGTLNVLRAAQTVGIPRVILTSSAAAVVGSGNENRVYTAKDWSNPSDPLLTPYTISKTIAEQVAWSFTAEAGIELAVINPALVLGPALERDFGSSLEVIRKLMARDIPLLPKRGFEIIDVRDVAILHRLAFERPEAAGQRFIAANGFLRIKEIAAILKKEFPGFPIPSQEMPNWLSRIVAKYVKEIGSYLNDLDSIKQLDSSPARALGWEPRNPSEAITAGGRSLIDLSLI